MIRRTFASFFLIVAVLGPAVDAAAQIRPRPRPAPSAVRPPNRPATTPGRPSRPRGTTSSRPAGATRPVVGLPRKLPPRTSPDVARARQAVPKKLQSLKARLLTSSSMTSVQARKELGTYSQRMAEAITASTKSISSPITNARRSSILRFVPAKHRTEVQRAFTNGVAEAIKLEEDIVVYRHTDAVGAPGRYFAPIPYPSATGAKLQLALPKTNDSSRVEAWLIPKGSVILRGGVADQSGETHFPTHAPGGGIQIYLPDLARARPFNVGR